MGETAALASGGAFERKTSFTFRISRVGKTFRRSSRMQASDMRLLRTLCSHKYLLLHPSRKPTSLSSLIFSPNPRFSRQFHFTPHFLSAQQASFNAEAVHGWPSSSEPPPADSSSDTSKNPGVYTVYDPITGRLTTKRGKNGSELESSTEKESQSAVDLVDGSNGRVYGEIRGSSKKKGKSKDRTAWVCSDCGYAHGQWWGICKECNAVNTLKRFSVEGAEPPISGIQVSENITRSWFSPQSSKATPTRLTDVNQGINPSAWRIPLAGLFGAEVERVLGGGVVPGSLILVGGDPGVGKSTLLLQIAALMAEGHDKLESAPVVYVSGEESVEQIGSRAGRMRIETEDLFLYASTDIEDILEKTQALCPRALIIDSIQTVYLKGVTGSAGGLAQVKECTGALLRFAKKTNIPVFLIGHVTKSGDIAGPRMLEHIVDVVLYMEGEKYSSHRLLRTVKNRFGSTDELGVFEMSQSGLQAVSNPSEMYLSEQHTDSRFLTGLAVTVDMDGSQPFVLEIQALCVSGSTILKQINGVKAGRADLIISVLMKQAGLKLQENGIFLNVVSGVNLSDTAGDLAIAAAICSSFLEFPIPLGTAFIGEVGLGGELRMVPRIEKRVITLAKLGYKMCIVPKSVEKSLSTLELGEMKVTGCRNLKEMINTVFRAG